MTPKTPAGQLVLALGNAERIAALLAPDARWSLPLSTPFPHPIVGRDAIYETMKKIWSEHYKPDVEVEFHDEVGDERASAARYNYRAFALAVGKVYENEYMTFVRSGPEGISEVFEGFDTKRTLDFFHPDKKVEFAGFKEG